jgi:DNA-binding transcriptional MerR regulator
VTVAGVGSTGPGAGTVDEPRYRIGEIAERTGVTPRTIRYYEERGLLGADSQRPKGGHRLYTGADVARLAGLIRLRDLLGLTLEELIELTAAEDARAQLREEWEGSESDDERLRIVEEAIPHVERQLALVRARQENLAAFAGELEEKLDSLNQRRRDLSRR